MDLPQGSSPGNLYLTRRSIEILLRDLEYVRPVMHEGKQLGDPQTQQAEQQAEAVRLAKLYVSCGVRGPLWEREYPGGFNSGKGANNGKGVWYVEDDDHLVMQTMHGLVKPKTDAISGDTNAADKQSRFKNFITTIQFELESDRRTYVKRLAYQAVNSFLFSADVSVDKKDIEPATFFLFEDFIIRTSPDRPRAM